VIQGTACASCAGARRKWQARRRAGDLFHYHSGCPLYLLLAYAKAQATDLTPDEKKAVAGFAAIIKTAAGIAEGDA
jgi:hypothetical protein